MFCLLISLIILPLSPSSILRTYDANISTRKSACELAWDDASTSVLVFALMLMLMLMLMLY